jgi:L-lactate dehydrogenase (cytochrome)
VKPKFGLGARFVFLGRPFIYAAAIGGAEGVRHAITLLRDEVDRNMAMLGAKTIADVNNTVIVQGHGTGRIASG